MNANRFDQDLFLMFYDAGIGSEFAYKMACQGYASNEEHLFVMSAMIDEKTPHKKKKPEKRKVSKNSYTGRSRIDKILCPIISFLLFITLLDRRKSI